MMLTEARKVLGLGADEDPRPHLKELHDRREQLATMVRQATNAKLAAEHQVSLAEFDRAMETLWEYLEAQGRDQRGMDTNDRGTLEPRPSRAFLVQDHRAAKPFIPPVNHEPLPEIVEVKGQERTDGKFFRVLAWLMIPLCLIGIGGWIFFKVEEKRNLEIQERVEFLARQGAIFIENRRWPEAQKALSEVEAIAPGSNLAKLGRRRIEAGKAEEQSQFIGYWKGEAIAAFEASRWDDAEKAARMVLDKYSEEGEIQELISRIAKAKKAELREMAFTAVRKKISERDFDGAISAAGKLVAEESENLEAGDLLREAYAAKEEATEDLKRARELAAKAAERDSGEYDEEALDWMREALALAPDDESITARYEKMASYTRTIRVPEDVKTLSEALASPRDRDRIVIAEGIWEGPFIIGAGVELKGVSGKTILQCEAETGSVLEFLPGVKEVRVSGLTVRHLSFDAGEKRFSLAHVRGAGVDFSDCRFEQGSGHGIAITEGGHAEVTRSHLTENGWNGIAVTGPSSRLVAKNNVLEGNFQNGIEGWDGATVMLTDNVSTGNSRNGIHIDSGVAAATVLDNKLSGNREFGMVATSAGSGEITGNAMEKNYLGGLVVRSAAGKVSVRENAISLNKGPGLVLEKGVSKDAYDSNRTSGNDGKQIVSGIDFSEEE